MNEPLTTFAEPPSDTHPPLDSPDYHSTARRHPTRPLLRLPAGLTDPAARALIEGEGIRLIHFGQL